MTLRLLVWNVGRQWYHLPNRKQKTKTKFGKHVRMSVVSLVFNVLGLLLLQDSNSQTFWSQDPLAFLKVRIPKKLLFMWATIIFTILDI